MKKPKVLMLGWEYPPMVNGGLGIACHGLANALAKKTELSLILPRAETNVEGFQLIGLNQKTYFETITTEVVSGYSDFVKLFPVDAQLDPYLQLTLQTEPTLTTTLPKAKKVKQQEVVALPPFDMKELYGQDLLKNTTRYTQLAVEEGLKLDFDVIHCHDWMTMPAGIELKKRSGKPLVVHVHSLEHDRSGPDSMGLIYQLEKWGMEQADAIVPVSNYTGRIAFSKYHIDPRKLFTIHNGTQKIDAYRKAKPFKDQLVVFAGRVTEQKGPLQFVDIAAKVLAKKPNTRFVMAGTGNLLAPSIESSAHKKLGGRLHFTGHLNRGQLFDLLSMADIYCMPSVSEPFGLTALEATQFKVPCVVSAQSGMYEILKGALFADYWNSNRFAEHTIRLLNDESLRRQCVEQASKDIKSCTWDHAAERAVSLYSKLIPA